MAETSIMDQQSITQLLVSITTVEDRNRVASAAVRRLSEQAAVSAAEIGDFVWDVYNAVFDAVAQTAAEHQDGLVFFMEQLRQAEVLDGRGQPLNHEDGRVWMDLPTFGWVARDLWNFGRS